MDDKGAYIPTPEEIVAGCAEIRQRWSRGEELRRQLPLVYCRDELKARPTWTAPVVHVDAELAEALK